MMQLEKLNLQHPPDSEVIDNVFYGQQGNNSSVNFVVEVRRHGIIEASWTYVKHSRHLHLHNAFVLISC